jgi:hypothetical protein
VAVPIGMRYPAHRQLHDQHPACRRKSLLHQRRRHVDVSMGMEDCTQLMKVLVPASVYCLKSSGNVELFRKCTEHLDPGVCRWIRRAPQSSLALSAQPLGLSPARCGSGEFTEAGPT